jgi:hypothetical protein
MNDAIDDRFQRAWRFFLQNAGALVLAALAVCLGFLLVVPGPWLSLNLLGEIAGAMRESRPVNWKATYQRSSTFLPAWGLTLLAGACIAFGLAFCVVPGVVLALTWMRAPLLVAEGTPVLQALRQSPSRLRSPESWIGALLDGCVLAACALAASLTAVLTVVALPVGLAFLALCSMDPAAGPLARIERVEAAG